MSWQVIHGLPPHTSGGLLVNSDFQDNPNAVHIQFFSSTKAETPPVSPLLPLHVPTSSIPLFAKFLFLLIVASGIVQAADSLNLLLSGILMAGAP